MGSVAGYWLVSCTGDVLRVILPGYGFLDSALDSGTFSGDPGAYSGVFTTTDFDSGTFSRDLGTNSGVFDTISAG